MLFPLCFVLITTCIIICSTTYSTQNIEPNSSVINNHKTTNTCPNFYLGRFPYIGLSSSKHEPSSFHINHLFLGNEKLKNLDFIHSFVGFSYFPKSSIKEKNQSFVKALQDCKEAFFKFYKRRKQQTSNNNNIEPESNSNWLDKALHIANNKTIITPNRKTMENNSPTSSSSDTNMKRPNSSTKLSDPSLFKATGNSLILHDPIFNKGTAFSAEERKKYGLRGLLPPRVETITHQLVRALTQFRSFKNPIEKYIYLMSLQARSQTLFFRLLVDNLIEMLPIVYTPTVGQACIEFDQIWRSAQGMYISLEDKGEISEILNNWNGTPDIIVVTDGSRILGLGDLGSNGMGIPIGKLNLYVGAGGFHPSKTLPITIDVGTNNENLLKDEMYLGLRRKRVRGEEFYELMEEFMMAVKNKWPSCLVQFEDFSNDVCFDLLEKYRNRVLSFNDDIQGTGAVIVAGFVNAARITKKKCYNHKLLFLGAGAAATGVADQCYSMMKLQAQADGLTEDEINNLSKDWIYLVDSKGLVTESRADFSSMPQHKVKYARKDITEDIRDLLDVVKKVKPTCLIGLSGQGGAFTKEIIEEMANINEKPIIFALSNPTKNSECSAKEAIEYTQGKAIFASGSPFEAVQYNGKSHPVSQGNNVYIFPGLGLGATISRSKAVSDTMVLAAAKTLAEQASNAELENGELYPNLSHIRDISYRIAIAVAKQAAEEGLSQLEDVPKDEEEWKHILDDYIFFPEYASSEIQSNM
ncbi:hypothetical protein ABK040_011729 [Willaertia magna]